MFPRCIAPIPQAHNKTRPRSTIRRLPPRLGGWGLQALPAWWSYDAINANDEDKDSDYYDCDDVDSAGGGHSVSGMWVIYIIFQLWLAEMPPLALIFTKAIPLRPGSPHQVSRINIAKRRCSTMQHCSKNPGRGNVKRGKWPSWHGLGSLPLLNRSHMLHGFLLGGGFTDVERMTSWEIFP